MTQGNPFHNAGPARLQRHRPIGRAAPMTSIGGLTPKGSDPARLTLMSYRAASVVVAIILILLTHAPAMAFDLSWLRSSAPDTVQTVASPRPVVSEFVSDQPAQARSVPGEVVAHNEVALGFLTLGRLIERKVNLGDMVQAGDVLAQLDPEDFDDQVRAATAAVAAAQAQYDTMAATASRTQFLAKREVTSTAQLEQVKNALASTRAALRQAESQLVRARDQQGFADIIAPFDGVISAIWAEPGEVIQTGAPVVTLSGRKKREAVIDLPEAELKGMAQGTLWTVWQQADPALRFAAPVDRIAPRADIHTRTRRVHLALPPEASFRLGALIRAARSDHERQQLTLPESAIMQERRAADGGLQDGAASIWVVIRDPDTPDLGQVTRHAVTISLRPDGRVNVSDLNPGAEIVIRGVNSLTEGQPVARSVAP